MKKIISMFAIGMVAATHAAVVTYNFDAGLDDSTSGSDLAAGTLAYAVGTNTDGGPEIAQRAWDSVNKASGDYLLSVTQRGLGNKGVDDEDLTTTAAATLQFTLTPNSGESLSFSTISTLDFDALLYTDINAFKVGYKIWADTGSGFVALDTLQTATSAASAGTEARLKQTDETTDLPDFNLVAGEVQSSVQSLSFDISSLGALADDQSVTLAIAMSSDRNNQYNFGNGIDNLVVDLSPTFEAPTGLTADAFASRVELDWEVASGAASYNVYRSETSATYGAILTNVADSAYSDTNVVNNTTYYYVVSAVDASSTESGVGDEASATPTDTPPTAPTGLTANTAANTVILDWNNNSEQDVDSYNVYRSETAGTYGAAIINVATSAYTDPIGLNNGTTYFYVVSAVDGTAQESANSDEVYASRTVQTVISVANLLDDPSFTSTPDTNLPSAGNEMFMYVLSGEKVQFQTDADTSVAGDNSSFTAPINIDTHTIVTDQTNYDPATTKLTAITPHFNGDDMSYTGALPLIEGDQQLDAWYVITLDTTNGTYTATSDRANLFGGEDIQAFELNVITAWNSISWDDNPFISGGIVYADINSIGIEFFEDTLVANTTNPATAWFNLQSAPISYTSVIPDRGYDGWAASFGLIGGQMADDDGDGLSNIYEFGAGGNPTNPAEGGHKPSMDMTMDAGTNWMHYTHVRRTDPVSGINYILEESLNLMTGNWTTASFEEVGSAILPADPDFERITRRVSATETQKFIRLRTASGFTSPKDLDDGIEVGTLDIPGAEAAVKAFIADDNAGKYNNLDSLLIWKDGKLVFERYNRVGRIDEPHYMMSVTKTMTSVVLARAIQLGYLDMDDLDEPVIDFMPELDRSTLQPGVETITLRDALFMESGIRLPTNYANPLTEQKQAFWQKIFENTEPITPESKVYQYSGINPEMILMILDIKTGGDVIGFIQTELGEKMGADYSWNERHGFPQGGAGSYFTSRFLIKVGVALLHGGMYGGEQWLSPDYVDLIMDTNKGDGYFYYFHNRTKFGFPDINFISGIGAGGQYMSIYPNDNMVIAATSTKSEISMPLIAIEDHFVDLFMER